MRLADSRWLTDENIHPEVVANMRARDVDVLDVKEQGWVGRSDEELLEKAHREGRIVLTHDGDFGTLALLGRRPVVGIVRVRPGHMRAQETTRRSIGCSRSTSIPLPRSWSSFRPVWCACTHGVSPEKSAGRWQ